MILSTTPSLEGKTIVEYRGIVVGEAILGANIFKDLFAGIRDIIGGRSGAYAKELAKAREMALRFLDLAPSAVADSKRLMRAPGREQLRKVIEEEGVLFGQRLRSPEAIEALSAFMQRRKPDFSRFA